MKMTIHHAGHYTRKETRTFQTEYFHLGLTLAGRVFHKTFSPAGRLLPPPATEDQPCLTLSPPKITSAFSFNEKRDNYVILLDLPELAWQEEKFYFLYDYNGTPVPLSRSRLLSMEKALFLREIFEKIIFLKESALPAGMARAEFLVIALLQELMAGDEEEKREPVILLSLAAQLQEAIKKDTHFQYTVRDHCRKLGYTTGHCRKLFTREMHLDPGEYRMRCRMERILSLLSGGSLTYKEIAFEVGMKHVTHLHSFVKKRTGKTLDSLADSLAR